MPTFDNDTPTGRLIGKMGEASSLQTMIAVGAAVNAGLPWHTVVAMSCSAIIGAAQTAAALVGNADTAAHGVTNDTVLFVSLLACASLNVKPVDDNPDAVTNDFDQDNTTYLTAMSMFEKLTGRKIDSALHPKIIEHANLGAGDAADLLKRVCANRRPA